jgi:hypothetical protein
LSFKKIGDDVVATSIDAPQHVRVDTTGSQTEGIKDVASLRLALSPIKSSHGTINHAVHHSSLLLVFVIHRCYHYCCCYIKPNYASSRLIHPDQQSTPQRHCAKINYVI